MHGGSRQKHIKFVEALCREIELTYQIYPGEAETVFLGGGTPSLLSVDLFHKIAHTLRKTYLQSGSLQEFTIEVNPATVTPSKALAWFDAGVNRISLGVQSLNAQELKLLGRQHKPEDVQKTIRILREIGFTNVNFDLIFGLPGQDTQAWQYSLTQAVELQPEHISAYALTYEEDTPFFEALKTGTFTRSEALEAELFQLTYQILSESGYRPYEISNFSIQGYESMHNQAYWNGCDYLGFGPSAVSTIRNKRWKNIPSTDSYIEKLTSPSVASDLNELKVDIEVLNHDTLRKEKILLGLRTRNGLNINDPTLHIHEKQLEMLLQEKLIDVTPDKRIILTPQGRLVADAVALALI